MTKTDIINSILQFNPNYVLQSLWTKKNDKLMKILEKEKEIYLDNSTNEPLKIYKRVIYAAAIQWTGKNYKEVYIFTDEKIVPNLENDEEIVLIMKNKNCIVRKHDYIVKDKQENYKIMNEKEFKNKYKEVDE